MPRYGLSVMRLRGPAVTALHGLRQGTVPFCSWSRIRVVTISYTFTRCLRVASRAGLRPESPWPPQAARDGRDRRQLGLARPTLQIDSRPEGPGAPSEAGVLSPPEVAAEPTRVPPEPDRLDRAAAQCGRERARRRAQLSEPFRVGSVPPKP